MNQHTVIASAILAVAIVAAAWLMKPLPVHTPQGEVLCFENVSSNGDPNAALVDRCRGRVWLFGIGSKQWFVTLDASDEKWGRPK